MGNKLSKNYLLVVKKNKSENGTSSYAVTLHYSRKTFKNKQKIAEKKLFNSKLTIV